MPEGLNFEQAALIGVAYLTAWTAVMNAAQLRAGETILITGTTGAVGSAAARVAHRRGARVLGLLRSRSAQPLPAPSR